LTLLRLASFAALRARDARQQGYEAGAIEVWFADEARIGQKNGMTRRWARRGTRLSAPRDQRYASTYIFGAVCPQGGKGAALVCSAPWKLDHFELEFSALISLAGRSGER